MCIGNRDSLSVLPLFSCAALLTVGYCDAQAQSLTVSGSLSSEQINLGLAEASGRPGVGLSLEWEAGSNFFAGASGYVTTDAPAPNRTRNIAAYTGFHWGDSKKLQYDLTLLYRVYPGEFVTDWDYPELRFDIGISPDFGVSLSATNDFYGLSTNSFAVTGEYVRDFSDRYYSRVEGGHVYFDGSVIDSYSYVSITVGIRGNRWSIEGGYRASNANPFPAFRDPQIDNRFVLSSSWLLY